MRYEHTWRSKALEHKGDPEWHLFWRPGQHTSSQEVTWIDFEAYEVAGRDSVRDGDLRYPKWEGSLLTSSETPTDRFAHGDLRWDGCSNIAFDEQERAMLHSCGRDHAARLGRLLDAIYDLGREHMDHWEGE